MTLLPPIRFSFRPCRFIVSLLGQSNRMKELESNERTDRVFMQYGDFLVSFILLQARFMKLMNEKASLIERIQELEHITVQLSHETETIGEYLC